MPECKIEGNRQFLELLLLFCTINFYQLSTMATRVMWMRQCLLDGNYWYIFYFYLSANLYETKQLPYKVCRLVAIKRKEESRKHDLH
jgi:hypothetical protein